MWTAASVCLCRMPWWLHWSSQHPQFSSKRADWWPPPRDFLWHMLRSFDSMPSMPWWKLVSHAAAVDLQFSGPQGPHPLPRLRFDRFVLASERFLSRPRSIGSVGSGSRAALSVPWASRFAAKESFACARYLETKDIVMSPRSLMNQGTYVSENRLYHWNSLNFYWGKWWATNINIWGTPFSDYTIWSCLWSLSHFAESSAYTISQLLLIPVVMTTDPQGLSEHLILSGIVHPQKRANTYIIFHWHCHFQRVTTYLEGF